MKAVKFEKPWEAACVEKDKPVPGPGEALLHMRAAGICGSDIGAFRGTNGLVSYSRNIFVGVGGRETINKSHMLSAVCGMEKALGIVDSPCPGSVDRRIKGGYYPC